MPDAVEVQIANAVVAELNDPGRPWAGQFVAVRSWLPVYEAADLAALRVSVVPLTLEQQQLNRASEQREYGLVVDFQKKVGAATLQADADALAYLAEQILDFFSDDHPLATLGAYTVRDARRPDIYDLERLYADLTWETMIALTIRGYA